MDEEGSRKITGGNADVSDNKGLGKMAIHNLMKTNEIQIDGWLNAIGVAEEVRGQGETLLAKPSCGH